LQIGQKIGLDEGRKLGQEQGAKLGAEVTNKLVHFASGSIVLLYVFPGWIL
jgi:hypothetical protein